MSMKSRLVESSVKSYRLTVVLVFAATLVMAALAGAPSIWPKALPFLKTVAVDTDPENMLSADEPVRVFHNRMKEELALHDMVVVGVVNDVHPDGVFNPLSLSRIHALTQFAKTLQWTENGETVGVIESDLIAPSVVDSIEPGGPGEVKFEWLMGAPPYTQVDAIEVRRKAERIPFLAGTLVSDDARAVALYLPLTSKDLSHRVYVELNSQIPLIWKETAEAAGRKASADADPDRVYITGLPVAEDTFGVEMFIQMAISAPTAMLVIFILMMVFFRKLIVVVSPLVVAMVSVIFTMGALIIALSLIHISEPTRPY